MSNSVKEEIERTEFCWAYIESFVSEAKKIRNNPKLIKEMNNVLEETISKLREL